MSRKEHSFVSVGITSLFLIFSVLCLVILALLTLGTSRSDLRMSRLSLEQTTAYYEACGEITDLYSRIDNLLSQTYIETDDTEGYYSKVCAQMDALSDSLTESYSTDASVEPEENPDLPLAYDETSHRLSLHQPISDSQILYAELEVLYPQEGEASFLVIHTWKTKARGDWNPDTKQPVYKGELQ